MPGRESVVPFPRRPAAFLPALGAVLIGCGGARVEAPKPIATPPPEVAPAAAAQNATGAGTEGEAADDPGSGFEAIWKVQDPGGWNHALAVAPSGDVLSLSAFDLAVLARHDGSVLERARVCDSIALRAESLFVHGLGAIVVCTDAVHEVLLPGLSRGKSVALPWSEMEEEATACAAGAARLAVGNRRGELVEIDLESLRIVGRHEVPGSGSVESIAYLPGDAGLVVSVDRESEGEAVFVLREGGFTPVPRASRGSGAIAVSRDGRELFCEAGSFEAGWLDLATGAVRGAQEISSWLKAARLVRGDLVAATGAHGTALFDGRGREPRSLDSETGEGLAVSGDGAVICAGDRSGVVSCWSRGEVAPSAYVAAPTPQAAAGDAPEAEVPVALSVSGTIRSRKGRNVAVSLEGEAAPAVGARGRLYKYFEREIAGFRTSGWIDVAAVEVESVGAGSAELRVVEEHSEILVNGRRVDHFARGAKIRLDVE